jgi:hypothetical protein
VDGLEIELVRRFQRHEPHRRPLHGFSNRFGIQQIILLRCHKRLDELRRD